jgi:hypothetical protein
VLLPPSLRTSNNNWLPDGKTAAWYVHEIQLIGHPGALSYDPTSAEWKTLTLEGKQIRREQFELQYKRVFGSLPAYGTDGNPIIPNDLQIPRDLGGLSIWAGPGPVDSSGQGVFDHNIPGKNFLTYSKLVSRNCR